MESRVDNDTSTPIVKDCFWSLDYFRLNPPIYYN